MAARQTIVGLDFGTFSIKAVWLEKRGAQISFLRAEELHLPPETQDPVRFITPWLEKHGILRQYSAISLPGSQAAFQPVMLAPNDPRTPEQAAVMEVAAFNDMAGENMTHRAATFEWTPGARQMLMAMVRPGVIDRALRGAAAFALRLCDMVPAPIAVYNAVAPVHGPRPAPTLFINIGHTTTDITVGTVSGALFARSFAMGGKAFTDAIVKQRGGSPAQADRAKRVEGSLTVGSPLCEILLPVADNWFAQLRSSLAVYRSHFNGEAFQMGDVVLAGGAAQLAGLKEHLAQKLELPVILFDQPDIPAAFATAWGLALGGARVATCDISLLPQRMRDEIVFRQKKPYWVAAGICAALALAIFIVSGIRGIARERAAVETESRRINELRQIDTRIKRIRSSSGALREFGEPVMELLQSGPLARELVTLVANSINADDWVTLICDEALYLPPPPPEATNAPPRSVRTIRDISRRPNLPVGTLGAVPGPAGRSGSADEPFEYDFSSFIIEGYTPNSDLATVKELVRRLLASDLVSQADIREDERVLPAALLGDVPPDEITRDLTRFVVNVKLNRP